jgi:hypothetical protein
MRYERSASSFHTDAGAVPSSTEHAASKLIERRDGSIFGKRSEKAMHEGAPF